MTFVVDASAVGAMLFNEPNGATIRAHIRGESVIAPTLIDYELANICVKRVRRYHRQVSETLFVFAELSHLPITRVPVPAKDAADLAVRTGLSAYDAAYLWLALSQDVELVTLDHRLAEINQQLRDL